MQRINYDVLALFQAGGSDGSIRLFRVDLSEQQQLFGFKILSYNNNNINLITF